MAKKAAAKRSNPNDLTLRNLRAAKKRIQVMDRALRDLGRRVARLEKAYRKAR